MNELSLFTGAGGGVLGTKLLGWRTVGYVEWEKYCQKIIEQRIKDGFLDEAPIFGDIDHFIKSGAAKKYAGYVDVVTAGFPCQPFSVAGKKKGQDDERNKWPQTIQTIRDVRPRFALLENVPGLLNSGYFHEILGSLAESGFDVRWDCISAAAVGAPHRRDRLWILAKSQHPDPNGLGSHREEEYFLRGLESNDEQISLFGSVGQVLADSDSTRQLQPEGSEQNERRRSGDSGEDVADSDSPGLQQGDEAMAGGSPEQPDGRSLQPGEDVPHPDDPRLQGRLHDRKFDSEGRQVESDGCPTERGTEWERSGNEHWWSTEPDVGRVANGVASRVDRLKAIGNGQVPAVAATAWLLLTDK